jgi:hypothetical protein
MSRLTAAPLEDHQQLDQSRDNQSQAEPVRLLDHNSEVAPEVLAGCLLEEEHAGNKGNAADPKFWVRVSPSTLDVPTED